MKKHEKKHRPISIFLYPSIEGVGKGNVYELTPSLYELTPSSPIVPSSPIKLRGKNYELWKDTPIS
jgi:hypothetical protein